jgi:hypothetical protein
MEPTQSSSPLEQSSLSPVRSQHPPNDISLSQQQSYNLHREVDIRQSSALPGGAVQMPMLS